MRPWLPIALVSVVCFVIGCGPAGIKTVPVKGKITYQGGDWPAECIADFACEKTAEGFSMHPASAKIAKDGSFTAVTENVGNGLVPGTYVVNLTCWEVPPQMENPAAAKSYLPPKALAGGAIAGMRIEVKPDDKGPIIFNYDVKE